MRLAASTLALGLAAFAAASCASPADTESGTRSGSAERSWPPTDDRDVRPRNSVPSRTP